MTVTKNGSARTFYKLKELQDKAAEYGYLIDFKPQRRVFELKELKNPENWCWLIRRANGSKVELVRDCTIEEWDDVLSYNIERLRLSEEKTNKVG
ncbi:hypothetical protein [Yersinia ruckeri]|uniref:hypothetical protein n=1 Tax=Yersinia ruckeri TaxID=29486 RepID=UPI0020BFE349|nr:hypothetical protein [Yersinia ruckeri]EKN4689526.1 hypothetical protein [Yersinia ruckeri]MCK8586358.1 hypothetical protein [Yersinia ruckeri]MCW6615600.1 hypothetical protein [Yersinia ruckeri]